MLLEQPLPRIVRFRDAPRYLGMDRNRFNLEVRPSLTEIPIGKQGIGFDRLELDAWVDEYVARNGRPARQKGVKYMGRKRMPGLTFRGGIWHIDKSILGRRVCQSTGTAQLEEAGRYLARVMEQERQAQIYGVRPQRTFEQAAARFVLDNQHKRSLPSDIVQLRLLMPWIGHVPIHLINGGTLRPWALSREKAGKAAGTVNHGLKIVRRIMNLAASEWFDEHGLTWLLSPPKIKLLPDRDKRPPYPLSYAEQEALLRELPEYLAQMALFAVNTGCPNGEREVLKVQ